MGKIQLKSCRAKLTAVPLSKPDVNIHVVSTSQQDQQRPMYYHCALLQSREKALSVTRRHT